MLVLAMLAASLSTLTLVLHVNAEWEDDLLLQVADTVPTRPGAPARERMLALLHLTHRVLEPRVELFAGRPAGSLRDRMIRSTDSHFIDGKGACGSYAGVLGRLLQLSGFEVRLVSMTVNGVHGGHILVEAGLSGRWATLDAAYDLAFVRPDGDLASFAEVSAQWDTYRAQVPRNYPPEYRYEGARYTNWDDPPILMPALHSVLAPFLGEDLETFSLRAHLLNAYRAYEYVAAGLAVLMSLFAWRVSRPSREKANIVATPGGEPPVQA